MLRGLSAARLSATGLNATGLNATGARGVSTAGLSNAEAGGVSTGTVSAVGRRPHRTAHLPDRAAGALALAALPLHVWLLVAHSHGLLFGVAIAAMVLVCAVCGVHVLRGTTGCRPLQQLQAMAVLMVLAHAAMTAGIPGVTTGGGGHHHAGRGAVVGNGVADAGPMLAIMGLELAVALCSALTLARRRRLHPA